MGQSRSVEHRFMYRLERIPALGLGLSVDVYSPDLFELIRSFEGRTYHPSYLEIFRATPKALQAVRAQDMALPLPYHGEGLWVTQPNFASTSFFEQELDGVAEELAILRSPWLNHECATKQMAGYTFGTYLPPLYTVESAKVVADNIRLVQERLDQADLAENVFGPLFLLELPPLTYFMAGTISIPQFFRFVTDQVECGLVLDIGHLWSVYRYSQAKNEISLEAFVERFLNEFPLERVVEIHVAGLACHESLSGRDEEGGMPEWLDAHAAPIRPVSLSMLEQVLAHPHLVSLRAVALEVDTKPIGNIIKEFENVSDRFGATIRRVTTSQHEVTGLENKKYEESTLEPLMGGDSVRTRLQEDYSRYAKVVSGQIPPVGPEWKDVRRDSKGLDRYIREYLPYEILHWGGDIAEMFPDTCAGLRKEGVALDDIVFWWFHAAEALERPYDFFLLKIDRVLGFVAARAPQLLAKAKEEAQLLQLGYAEANDAVC
ncbi:multinuclear nonheme iron-dependent oxidase, partial [Petrachloros mirabilis]